MAIVSSGFPPARSGGIASANYHICRILRDRGFEVRVFTFGEGATAIHDEVHRTGAPPSIASIIGKLNALIFRILDKGRQAFQLRTIIVSQIGAWRLRREIRRFAPDILVTQDHGAPLLALDIPAGCQVIMVSHHNPWRFVGNPLIGQHSELDASWSISLENRALRKVDKIICPSRYMEQIFRRTYRYDGTVTVIPNAVDVEVLDGIEAASLRAELGLGPSAPLVYVPSAGSNYKGEMFVFELIRRLAGASDRIGFYLSGNLTQNLRYQLRHAPSNVTLHAPGHVSYSDNIASIKACTFGVSPCLYESFGMAILEANVCGVPMVCFDAGGNRDITIDGQNGYVVPYMDVEALIAKCLPLLEESTCSQLRRTTRQATLGKFQPDEIARRLVEYLEA